MDSDLAEAVSNLKSVFEQRKIPVKFGQADAPVVERLRKTLKVPARYRSFLLSADPVDVETVTPVERVRFIPAEKLVDEQVGYSVGTAETPANTAWRKSWILVARSALLGDPYFLDISKLDPEGDCPVYTAMSGTDSWQPKLCASTFALFLKILAIGMEVARGFNLNDYDVDNEQVFREALGPKIREHDPAALKAGHWT